MSIEAGDLKLFKSAVVNNTDTNGGGMSDNEVISNQATNLFPNVTQAEREAGITRYRKAFSKLHDAGDETLYNHVVGMISLTPADDYIQIFPGTNDDVQSDIEGETDWQGAGLLNAPAAVDATSLEVLFETEGGIYTGDKAFIRGDGNEEFIDVTDVSWTAEVATITISDGLNYAYPASTEETPVVVSSLLEFGDTTSSIDSFVVTSSAGTFDEGMAEVYNQGTVQDDWEITINAGNDTLTCVGINTGLITSTQSVANEFKPNNPNVEGAQGYYFRIQAGAFGGAWVAEDTLTFSTHHAAKAIWFKQTVPASTASKSNNTAIVRVAGESA